MARWLWVRCPPVRVRQGPLSSQAGGHRVHDGLSAHGYRVSRSAAAVAAAAGVAAAVAAAAGAAATAVAAALAAAAVAAAVAVAVAAADLIYHPESHLRWAISRS